MVLLMSMNAGVIISIVLGLTIGYGIFDMPDENDLVCGDLPVNCCCT
jgi:hypothetical protein